MSNTNVQIVTEIMERSQHGALAQLFVIEALTKWSDVIINMTDEQKAKFESGLIRADAWQSVAREIKDKLEAHLNGPVSDEEEGDVDERDECAHNWVYTGTAYGGDDPSFRGEGRVICSKCGADGDA